VDHTPTLNGIAVEPLGGRGRRPDRHAGKFADLRGSGSPRSPLRWVGVLLCLSRSIAGAGRAGLFWAVMTCTGEDRFDCCLHGGRGSGARWPPPRERAVGPGQHRAAGADAHPPGGGLVQVADGERWRRCDGGRRGVPRRARDADRAIEVLTKHIDRAPSLLIAYAGEHGVDDLTPPAPQDQTQQL
jgi:hypothetical protein